MTPPMTPPACILAGLFALTPRIPAQNFQPYSSTSDERVFGSAGDIDADGVDDLVLASLSGWPTPSGQVPVRIRRGIDGVMLLEWVPSVPTVPGYITAFQPEAGDLDLDGHDDMALVLAYQYHVEIRSGLDGSLMALLEPWMFGWNNPFGTPGAIGGNLSAAGDLNGDGWPEIMIMGGPTNVNTGVAVLSGPSLTILYQYPLQYGTDFGFSLGAIEDMTGDGLPDFFIGAPRFSPVGPSGFLLEAGRLEFYSGSSGAMVASYSGSQQFQEVGWSVCGLGDVTGDGSPEVASIEFAHGGSGNVPRVVVREAATFSPVYTVLGLTGALERLGDANGDGVDEVLVNHGGVKTVVLSGVDGTTLVQLTPGTVGATLIGAALGDVNGDGLGDFGTTRFLISSPSTPPPFVPLAQNLSWGIPSPQIPFEAWIYAARNLRVVGPTPVGGSAQFDLLVPRHPGKTYQIVFSLTGSFPGISFGSFLFPLVPDDLFYDSFSAGIGGALGATGTASLSVPIPPNPSLQGLEVKASGWVIDPAATPLPIACVLTGTAFTIQ